MATDRTQSFVPLEEIRDSVIILPDGSLRAVLKVSSINFALKSSDEQEAILKQFQNFLNTLDFSLQLYVQSRELDINPYLALLASREEAQKNDLMKVQLREYMGFIRSFTHDTDIMTKSFFVVVSYVPAIVDVKKGIEGIIGSFSKKSGVSKDSFEENRSQLEQRIAIVEQGLARIGVRSVLLGTNELVDLFYHIFNPYEGKKALPATNT